MMTDAEAKNLQTGDWIQREEDHPARMLRGILTVTTTSEDGVNVLTGERRPGFIPWDVLRNQFHKVERVG